MTDPPADKGIALGNDFAIQIDTVLTFLSSLVASVAVSVHACFI